MLFLIHNKRNQSHKTFYLLRWQKLKFKKPSVSEDGGRQVLSTLLVEV